MILSVSCCLLTGDRWLIMQLGTAHYVPVLRLLNHFKILNSLINILWRAQGSDQGRFSPGRALTHWDPAYVRSWRAQTRLGRTMGCVLPRAVAWRRRGPEGPLEVTWSQCLPGTGRNLSIQRRCCCSLVTQLTAQLRPEPRSLPSSPKCFPCNHGQQSAGHTVDAQQMSSVLNKH